MMSWLGEQVATCSPPRLAGSRLGKKSTPVPTSQKPLAAPKVLSHSKLLGMLQFLRRSPVTQRSGVTVEPPDRAATAVVSVSAALAFCSSVTSSRLRSQASSPPGVQPVTPGRLRQTPRRKVHCPGRLSKSQMSPSLQDCDRRVSEGAESMVQADRHSLLPVSSRLPPITLRVQSLSQPLPSTPLASPRSQSSSHSTAPLPQAASWQTLEHTVAAGWQSAALPGSQLSPSHTPSPDEGAVSQSGSVEQNKPTLPAVQPWSITPLPHSSVHTVLQPSPGTELLSSHSSKGGVPLSCT